MWRQQWNELLLHRWDQQHQQHAQPNPLLPADGGNSSGRGSDGGRAGERCNASPATHLPRSGEGGAITSGAAGPLDASPIATCSGGSGAGRLHGPMDCMLFLPSLPRSHAPTSAGGVAAAAALPPAASGGSGSSGSSKLGSRKRSLKKARKSTPLMSGRRDPVTHALAVYCPAPPPEAFAPYASVALAPPAGEDNGSGSSSASAPASGTPQASSVAAAPEVTTAAAPVTPAARSSHDACAPASSSPLPPPPAPGVASSGTAGPFCARPTPLPPPPPTPAQRAAAAAQQREVAQQEARQEAQQLQQQQQQQEAPMPYADLNPSAPHPLQAAPSASTTPSETAPVLPPYQQQQAPAAGRAGGACI